MLLRDLFTEEEVNCIDRIPISSRRVDDSLIWHFNQNGKYSVKSGYFTERLYRLAPSTTSTSASTMTDQCASWNGGTYGSMNGVWQRLWRCNIPCKVKICVWRILSAAIPSRLRLRHKHCYSEDMNCLFCGDEVESEEHVFRSCPEVQQVWSYVPFAEKLAELRDVDVFHWITGCMDILKGDELMIYFTCLWLIWYGRNQSLWEKTSFNPDTVFKRATGILADYWRIHRKEKSTNHRELRSRARWRCPPSGRLKLNIDGSFDATSGRGGIRAILRDENEVGVAAVAKSFQYASSAFHMEVEACRVGLKLGLDHGGQHIDAESDSILLVSAIKGGHTSTSEVSHILGDCLEISKSFHSFNIDHVFREANNVADRLAYVAREACINNVWIGEMPDCIQDVLIDDFHSCAWSLGPMPPPDAKLYPNVDQ